MFPADKYETMILL